MKLLSLFLLSIEAQSSSDYPSNPNLIPNIGNGFLGTVIDSDSIYMSGLYCFTRHMDIFPGSQRCRIPMPAPLNTTVKGATVDEIKVDTEKGMVIKKMSVYNKNVSITNMKYAHRNMTSLIVNEFVVDNSKGDTDFTFAFEPGVESKASRDISFEPVDTNYQGVKSKMGKVVKAETGDRVATVAFAYTDDHTQALVVSRGSVWRFYFMATFRASFENETADAHALAVEDMNTAMALIQGNEPTLEEMHINGWSDL
jgi:hypothetical protein